MAKQPQSKVSEPKAYALELVRMFRVPGGPFVTAANAAHELPKLKSEQLDHYVRLGYVRRVPVLAANGAAGDAPAKPAENN